MMVIANKADAMVVIDERTRERDAARAENVRLRQVAKRAISTVPYVTATLRPVLADCRKHGARWGKAHGGRSYSSINQLEALKEDARKALEG